VRVQTVKLQIQIYISFHKNLKFIQIRNIRINRIVKIYIFLNLSRLPSLRFPCWL